MDSKVINKSLEYIKDNYANALSALANIDDITPEPLTVEELNFLHGEMVKIFGGSKEVRDTGLLESVSEAPFQSAFGVDLYPTIFDKAAKYLLDFTRYQIYVDGNKRMGLGSASTFLFKNGIEFHLTEECAYKLVMDIANNKITEIDEVSNIISSNCIFKEDLPHPPVGGDDGIEY